MFGSVLIIHLLSCKGKVFQNLNYCTRYTTIAPGEKGCIGIRVSKKATISDRSQDSRKYKMPLIYL